MSETKSLNPANKRIATRHMDIPAIGFGTWQLEGAEAESAVSRALDAGYTHIDTAQIYGNEQQVGNAIANSGVERSKLFLTTKIWIENFKPEAFQDSLKQSLEKLQTDYVDLLLLHWPNEDVNMAHTFRELDQALNDGITKHVGVSNFTKAWLRDAITALDAPVANNQVEMHPFLDQAALIKVCKANDIIVTAYSPLARGRVAGHATIEEIARKHGKTAAQVSLRWLNQNGIVAIPKGSSERHIRENLDIFDFTLEQAEMNAINSLGGRSGRLIDPVFAPEWD